MRISKYYHGTIQFFPWIWVFGPISFRVSLKFQFDVHPHVECTVLQQWPKETYTHSRLHTECFKISVKMYQGLTHPFPYCRNFRVSDYNRCNVKEISRK